jgi:hypothetical protein
LLAAAGVRYLRLDQGYHYGQVNQGGGQPVSETQLLQVDRNFGGVGPEVGLQGNVRLGDTGLSLFTSGRFSLLEGTTREHYGYASFLVDPTGLIPPFVPGSTSFNFQGNRNPDHTISVGELELGLEYAQLLGQMRLFCRVAGVGQTYFDAGNTTQGTGNLSLVGFQCSLGVNY